MGRIGPQKRRFGLVSTTMGKKWFAMIAATAHRFRPWSHSTLFFYIDPLTSNYGRGGGGGGYLKVRLKALWGPTGEEFFQAGMGRLKNRGFWAIPIGRCIARGRFSVSRLTEGNGILIFSANLLSLCSHVF